jgi:hypothetical protein
MWSLPLAMRTVRYMSVSPASAHITASRSGQAEFFRFQQRRRMASTRCQPSWMGDRMRLLMVVCGVVSPESTTCRRPVQCACVWVRGIRARVTWWIVRSADCRERCACARCKSWMVQMLRVGQSGSGRDQRGERASWPLTAPYGRCYDRMTGPIHERCQRPPPSTSCVL